VDFSLLRDILKKPHATNFLLFFFLLILKKFLFHFSLVAQTFFSLDSAQINDITVANAPFYLMVDDGLALHWFLLCNYLLSYR
jgi:hypothetical protein